ncbi:MAG: nicotinamide riboside transporter PnuC [Edaphocola sp.]
MPYFRCMDANALISYIIEQWRAVSLLEIVAVSFGVAEVLLSYRNSVLLYPAGIVSCALFIYLLAAAGLYAEAVLSLYYLVMSFYGWYKWVQRTKAQAQLPISACTPKDRGIVSAIILVAFVVLYATLKMYTTSDVPLWDAAVSATAWAGMWLLAKRKLENWVLLNVSNIMAIPLQFHKGLPLTACLTAFLFVVAIFGYFRWKKIMLSEAATA